MKKQATKKRDRTGELHLRPPADILARIRKAAEDSRRTLNAQALIYIERGLKTETVA